MAVLSSQGGSIGNFFLATGGSTPGDKFTSPELLSAFQALEGAAGSGRQVRVFYVVEGASPATVNSAIVTARRWLRRAQVASRGSVPGSWARRSLGHATSHPQRPITSFGQDICRDGGTR